MKKLLLLACSLIPTTILFSQTAAEYCAHGKIKSLHHTKESSSRSIESDKYDLHYHKLDLEMSNTSTYVKGNVEFRAKVSAPQLDIFEFDLHSSLTIDSIRFNGQLVTSTDNNGLRSVVLGSPLNQGDDFTARIYYKGLPTAIPGAAIGSGITNDISPSWGSRVTWTLSQPFSAYEWWPCKQTLGDKIDSIDVWVTVDDSLKAGSNGILTNITPLPGNKARYEWKHRHPIDNYLISVAVGNYYEYNIYANPVGAPNPILIQNYLYNKPAFISYVTPRIDLTADYLEHFSKLFGLYPFENEKYGHCAAPLSGGMEHQTMTTQGVFTEDIIAHELAHQWFGDYVTCASWKDIVLNEGWASYLEYIMREEFMPNTAATSMNQIHNSVMSQPGGSVYVNDTTDVNRIFNSRLTYDKGSAIFHTLRYEINNDSLFFAAMRNYLQNFAYKTAFGTDLKSSLENFTGMNFDNFFNQWYYGEGYPTINLRHNHANGIAYLKISQIPSKPTVTPLFKTPIDIRLFGGGADTTVRVYLTDVDTYVSFPYSKSFVNAQIDPKNWIINLVGSIAKDIYLSDESYNSESTFEIYPNPASQFIRIKSPYNSDIKLIDANGKTIKIYSAQTQEISLEMLAPGIYYLQSGLETKAFVKK